jgi:acyl-CoA thioester hydrolase
MYTIKIPIRVRYAETDRMNYVYYGRYAEYFEVARVEALRSLGINYKELEESGIILPVKEFSIDFIKPALYDDLLSIETIIPTLPTAKIIFKYITRNADDVILNHASTTLVFVNTSNSKPCIAPNFILEKLKIYFE